MGRVLRFPSEEELPLGPVRDFAAGLFDLFKAARRPAGRTISSAISRSDLPGTASHETVRRMLIGAVVPGRWETVDAVITVLCEMAKIDPDQPRDEDDYSSSRREDLESAWHKALDNPGVVYSDTTDPWASEPPF